MADQVLSKLILSVASVALFLLCCAIYVFLYKLDKLRYGDDMQIADHVVILIKIWVTLVAVSQLWLSDNYEYIDIFFLGGLLLIFICFRVSFREVRTQDIFFYVSILAALLFGTGACLAVIYHTLHKMQGDETPFFLGRSLLYAGCATVCLLVALAFYMHRTFHKDMQPSRVELIPTPDTTLV
jgi:hypothetical protein